MHSLDPLTFSRFNLQNFNHQLVDNHNVRFLYFTTQKLAVCPIRKVAIEDSFNHEECL